ncbi:acetylxylan esterase [Halochromatium salexigens]|uniref:Deacetylase n=1 Tax=Halochromatium salexigens TaxID=49447 RepID=A0AAJ0XIA1_HALSE|nr:acetylxylan esterase [Halochromatium salexigens]MBK5932312.1 deacetylase [Halochromatium salexigens]
MAHTDPFDPTYGYDLAGLLGVLPPQAPDDFAEVWQRRYQDALKVDPALQLSPSAYQRPGMRVWDAHYRSTDGITLGGWLLEPEHGAPPQGFVVGHGYGGIAQPDFALPCADAAYLVPCFRGIGRSRHPPISDNPNWHVLHDIDKPDRYIIGGCVQDLWIGVTALLTRFPDLAGHIGYMGISFGGGIGALAMPWDQRIACGHLNVPTFGHQPLRLQLPTTGSAASQQRFAREHGHLLETLAYYDAGSAARFIRQPMHIAAALFDPSVAPPTQFAIYNALAGPKQLFVLATGHAENPARIAQGHNLLDALTRFFCGDESRVSPVV